MMKVKNCIDGSTIGEFEIKRGANLTEADLADANLAGANLAWANLTRADLTRANLAWANLTGATGEFCTGFFGRHHGVAAGGYISIGCERHTFDHWLINYKAIGKANGYSAHEVAMYGAWIKMSIEHLTREKK